MRGHVDAESLALCAEGLLSRRRSGRIRSHVARCPACAAAQARLTEVPALLAQVPPPSLPPRIAARLDAALSAEAARRATQDPGIVPKPTTPAHRDSAPGSRPARSRTGGPQTGAPRLRFPVPAWVLAAAAGALVVAGGVGYAVSQSSLLSTSSSGSSSSGSVAAPASSTTASPGFRSPASGLAPGGAGGSARLTVRHSGTKYRKDTLAAQAAALLNRPSAGLNRPGKASGGLARQPSPKSAVTQCVDKVAGPGAVTAGEVKLVDQARYQGQPATVIVVQATPAQPGTVYVARCSAAHPGILAKAPLPG